ncbi:hypothetical protein AAFF_G00054020 [Aldrovandia affinis]|uniref:MADF domain-containing protein n=1 Tax=Aldrovandia affinis TaxID=143900 RepID=A0AAD7S184_9TELE|nr:hypothetical protein AAFF_G00054020 [Aldrovandia affinis]
MSVNSWKEIGQTLGMDWLECSKEWKKICNKFVRMKRAMAKKSGAAGGDLHQEQPSTTTNKLKHGADRAMHEKLDPILNETCRIVTGCIKTTPVHCLYALSGIAPPDIRRAVITKAKRTKQANDNRHSLHEHSAAQKRLSCRSSFLDTTEILETTPTDARITEWQNQWISLGSQTTQRMERGITPD